MRRLRKLLVILSILVVPTVLFLETVPRFVKIPGLRLFDIDPTAVIMEQARIEPHPYMAYAPKRNFSSAPGAARQISHNSLGFRGPEITWRKPEGTLRVLCLGGSSTYGHGPTSNATTWPARLEHYLQEAAGERKVQVINGGCQGYNTFESLNNLSVRGLPLEPDLVIVYHTINDMRCALYPGVVQDNTHWRANWLRTSPSVLEASYTYKVLRAKFTDYVEEQSDVGSYVIVDFERWLTSGRDPYRWRNDVGLESFGRNLESIVGVARTHGARVLLATQGMKRETIASAPSSDDQFRAFDAMTDIIRSVAASGDVALCEAAAVLDAAHKRLKARGESEGETAIFTNDVHMTDRGADLLARTLADSIQSQGLLDF